MFKNHTVQMKVVKDQKSNKNESQDQPSVDYVQIARESSKDLVKGTALLLGTYLAGDTLRKIAIHIVATKVR